MSSVFDALMSSSAIPAINDIFGQSATYTLDGAGTVYTVSAILQKDVVVPSGLTGVAERRTQVQISDNYLPGIIPKRGDVVTIGTDRWIVLSREADDGYISTFTVRPGDKLSNRYSVDSDTVLGDSTAAGADKAIK